MNVDDLFAEIAPARVLQIKPVHYAEGVLTLAAPLEPNLNDKGTGFAGSMASLLMLSAWGVITLRLREAGINAEVMVVESDLKFVRPAQAGLTAEAHVNPSALKQIRSDLESRGRSRVRIEARLLSGGDECAAMNASYAIIT